MQAKEDLQTNYYDRSDTESKMINDKYASDSERRMKKMAKPAFSSIMTSRPPPTVTNGISIMPVVDFASFPPSILKRYKKKMKLEETSNENPKQQTSPPNLINVCYKEISPYNAEEIFNDINNGKDDMECAEGSPQHLKLVDVCLKHFLSTDINEKDILPWFIYNIRNRDKVLKLKPPLPKTLDDADPEMIDEGMKDKLAITESTGEVIQEEDKSLLPAQKITPLTHSQTEELPKEEGEMELNGSNIGKDEKEEITEESNK
jgi:hypothetical protein